MQLVHLILSFDNNFNRLPFHYFVFKQRLKNIFLKNEKIKIRLTLFLPYRRIKAITEQFSNKCLHRYIQLFYNIITTIITTNYRNRMKKNYVS